MFFLCEGLNHPPHHSFLCGANIINATKTNETKGNKFTKIGLKRKKGQIQYNNKYNIISFIMETNRNYPICLSTYDNIDLFQDKHPFEYKFCSK